MHSFFWEVCNWVSFPDIWNKFNRHYDCWCHVTAVCDLTRAMLVCFLGDAGLDKLCQPGSLAVRKWRENEKKEETGREWRNGEEMERFTLRLWQHLDVNTGVSEIYSTWNKNMELLLEVCKCTWTKRIFICVTSFEKKAIGSHLLIFVMDSICMIFVEVMSAP